MERDPAARVPSAREPWRPAVRARRRRAAGRRARSAGPWRSAPGAARRARRAVGAFSRGAPPSRSSRAKEPLGSRRTRSPTNNRAARAPGARGLDRSCSPESTTWRNQTRPSTRQRRAHGGLRFDLRALARAQARRGRMATLAELERADARGFAARRVPDVARAMEGAAPVRGRAVRSSDAQSQLLLRRRPETVDHAWREAEPQLRRSRVSFPARRNRRWTTTARRQSCSTRSTCCSAGSRPNPALAAAGRDSTRVAAQFKRWHSRGARNTRISRAAQDVGARAGSPKPAWLHRLVRRKARSILVRRSRFLDSSAHSCHLVHASGGAAIRSRTRGGERRALGVQLADHPGRQRSASRRELAARRRSGSAPRRRLDGRAGGGGGASFPERLCASCRAPAASRASTARRTAAVSINSCCSPSNAKLARSAPVEFVARSSAAPIRRPRACA